jgi:hypothetical protein
MLPGSLLLTIFEFIQEWMALQIKLAKDEFEGSFFTRFSRKAFRFSRCYVRLS